MTVAMIQAHLTRLVLVGSIPQMIIEVHRRGDGADRRVESGDGPDVPGGVLICMRVKSADEERPGRKQAEYATALGTVPPARQRTRDVPGLWNRQPEGLVLAEGASTT